MYSKSSSNEKESIMGTQHMAGGSSEVPLAEAT